MNSHSHPPLRIPRFPGLIAALGPGVVWMALAQGSGELIWWPYLVAKYGLGLVFLLVPACLIQFPLTYEIGRYSLFTGETIFSAFKRLSPIFAGLLFILMMVTFLWFGAYAVAGGTALASLTNFPEGLAARGQSLFWGYATMGFFAVIALFFRTLYGLIEKIMWLVAIFTFAGLILACFNPEVTRALGSFVKGIFIPQPLARPWESKDATSLITAIAFAGLGGFWTLFYSYWILEKFHAGTSDTSTKPDFDRRWNRFLTLDSGIGIIGNMITTLMTCLLAYALLFPKGLLPEQYKIAVVQSEFFAASWGTAGKIFFLIIAAAFLSDTWLTTVHGVARIYSHGLYEFFPQAKKIPAQRLFKIFVVALTILTSVTMPLAQPGLLIQLTAVLGFLGTVLYSGALILLNKRFSATIPLSKGFSFQSLFLKISFLLYLILFGLYLTQFFL